MASKMTANTKWPQVHNTWLKFDDLDVYPRIFWDKEHIKTIKNESGPLSNRLRRHFPYVDLKKMLKK